MQRVLGLLVVVGAAVCLAVTASARTDHTAVSVNKTGAGTVTSNPRGSQCNNPPGANLCINGITCGNDCSDSFKQGTSVTFTATPDSGATFLGWGGACSGTSTTCSLTMPASDTSLSIDATFSGSSGGGGPPPPPPPPSRYALEVVKSGSGAGGVVSDPAGIDCGSTCAMTSDNGQQIRLTPTAAPGSVFKGFSGACSGATCVFTLTADSVVTAVFDTAAPVEYPLSVAKAGDGSGTVTSSIGGISCGAACSATLPAGTAVALSAVADSGSTFTGWSGACSGAAACALTLSAPAAVTATFAQVKDTTAPRVVAFAATAKRGKRAKLTYFVSDDSGRASERILVYNGRRILARLAAAEHVAKAGTVRSVTWKVPAKLKLGKRRFCVTATDPSGNASAASCAPLTIKR